jgi:lactate permease
LAPFLGWVGVFLTGSDTSSNALFSGVQQRTAQALGLNPVLTVAANSSGGVAAKMISPQSIAVATASTKLVGREGELFRRTVLHSLGIVTIVGVLTYLQAYYLTWMVPAAAPVETTVTAHFGVGDAVLVGCSIAALLVLTVLSRFPRQRTE